MTVNNGGTWNCITNNNVTVNIGGSVINNGTIDFDGGGAGAGGADTISIRSTVAGTQRDWSGSGTFEMDDVDVQDQTCITGTPAYIPQILNSEGTDSGNNINWNITYIAPAITISGTVYSDEGTTPITSNRTVRLVVYYTSTIKSSFTTTALAGTGVYNFTQIGVNNGTRMLVYIDNDALFFGSTANISDGPTVLGLDIYQNHLIIKDEAGVNITNNDLTNLLYPSSASPDADIRYTISGSDLTVDPGFEVYIANGSTFRPGGDISCSYLEVVGTLITDDNALTASSNVVISGSLNASGQTSPPNDIDIDGNVTCSGTFIQGNQPITLSGTTIDFTGAIFTDDGGATDETFILDRGGAVTFTPSGSNFGAFQISTLGTNVSLSADLQVDTLTIDNGTITLNSNGHNLYVSGNWVNNGTFIEGNNTVIFNGGGTSDVNSGASAVADADHDFNIIRIENNTTVSVIISPVRITNSLQLIGDNDIFDVNSLNFIINAIDFTGNNGTFELHGTQTTYTISNLDTTNGTILYSDGGALGYVRYSLFNNLRFAGGTHQLTGNMEVLNNITFISGQLNALNYTISLHGNFNSSGGGMFNAGTSTVLFIDNSIDSTVSGNNTFYNFTCNTGDKIIYFTFGNTATIAAGGTFSIQGVNDANRIELLSTYTATNPHTAPYDEIYYPAMQWRIDILPGAFADVNWAYVELSYSVRPVFPDDTIFRPTRYAGQYDWCHNWLNIMPVMNSGVEDSNNNGLIDRIRVQVVIGTTLDDDPATNPSAFDGMQLLIQSPWTVIGFNTDIPNDDTFYILIAKPGFALDTYSTPDWSISENNTLKTSTGERYVFTTPVGVDYSQNPADEADPIIGYTLARAGTSQVYVHLSEPVVNSPPSGGGAVTVSNFAFGAGNNPVNITPIGTREYLLNFNPATTTFTIDNIVNGDVVTYSNIVDPSTNNNQLHGAASVDHRVSDLALGTAGNEPIIPFILYDNTPREPGPGGVGYVTIFDGSEWIQDYPDQPSNTALLQANFGGSLYTANILWDTNVAATNKNNGLWLPVGSNTYGLVPSENSGILSISGTNEASPPAHSDFQFVLTNAELVNEMVVEFFISFTDPDPDLYAACLERPNAADWYRSIRPWAFGIHKPGGQKGNVTIFNNVINPNAGEITKLHYILKKPGSVTIQVFTLAGDIVKVLYRGNLSAGQHSTTWDGRNEGSRVVAKGMYFIRIVGPDIDETRKVLVVK